jgi:hypothetical protein
MHTSTMIVVCESNETQANQDLVCNFDQDVLFNSWNDCTAIQVTAPSLRRLHALSGCIVWIQKQNEREGCESDITGMTAIAQVRFLILPQTV